LIVRLQISLGDLARISVAEIGSETECKSPGRKGTQRRRFFVGGTLTVLLTFPSAKVIVVRCDFLPLL
jgi:hypothetical protein